jgi:flagellar biosynthetic protein FliQ
MGARIMTPETIYRVSQDAMIVAVKLTAPVLLPSLAIGLIIAMFQAATHINESTLTFVPKLIIIGLVLLIMGPWMLQMFLDYFQALIRDIPQLIG